MIENAISHISQNSNCLIAIASIIMAISSIGTFALASIVFISSLIQGKRNEKLIKELKIALVMIASIRGGADAGQRLYDEYKKKIS